MYTGTILLQRHTTADCSIHLGLSLFRLQLMVLTNEFDDSSYLHSVTDTQPAELIQMWDNLSLKVRQQSLLS